MVAPPWLPVPPTAYGGSELVIDLLCVGLQQAGHDVTLFTTGDSTCPVPRASILASCDPDQMGMSVLELRHVAAAYDMFRDFDIVHDHTLAGLFYSERFPDLPVVTTNHCPFNADLTDLYGRVAARIPVIAISNDQASRAPTDLPIAAVIHHGLDLDRYRFGRSPEDHVLFLGRMSPDKGVDVAVRVARDAGVRLLIAARMQEPGELLYFRRVVKPMMGGKAEYVGEADFTTKVELLSTARALINPIGWPEPFGLVMIEAMACGTPVVGYGLGAAPEIVDHGLTGFLATNERGLVAGLRRIDELDRAGCRQVVADRFSADRMVADHVSVYRDVLGQRAKRTSGEPGTFSGRGTERLIRAGSATSAVLP
jgi:glycosyltransferase involved in cell wall biosynthesis